MRPCMLLVVAGCRLGFDTPVRDAPGVSSDMASQLDAPGLDGNNDVCAGATTLTIGVPVAGTTCGGDDSITAACSNGSSDVFFTFQLAPLTNATLALTAGFTALVSRNTSCDALAPSCMANGDVFANSSTSVETWTIAI